MSSFRLRQAVKNICAHYPNPFSHDALIAAYNDSEDWLDECVAYIEENVNYFCRFMATYVPRVRVIKPDATYMVWVDCRELGLDHLALEGLMLNQAKLLLSEGYAFGPGGEGFERFNLACPRSAVKEACARFADVVNAL